MLRDCLLVTKPGIILGNLVTAGCAFLLASHGRVDIALLLATVAGIGLVIASACVLNNCIDRDMDRRMPRTCDRPLAAGRMLPASALCYAALLGVVGMTTLLYAANGLVSAIVAVGFIVYVCLYSLWLKPASHQAPLIGSLAGAAPPLAGYCAAGNSFDAGAMILLAMFVLWQMPHFYAISVYRRDEYAAANVPVLPLRFGAAAAKRRIMLYVPGFLAAAMALELAGYAGRHYLTAALLSGGAWLLMAWLAWDSSDNRRWGKRLFVCSIAVIMLLSLMMAIDTTPLPPVLSVQLTSQGRG